MAGVSNYGVAHIEELMASNPRVKPVVNQIEVHPFNTQKETPKTHRTINCAPVHPYFFANPTIPGCLNLIPLANGAYRGTDGFESEGEACG